MTSTLSWEDKIQRLRQRKPLERTVTLYDDQALEVIEQAKLNLVGVRQKVARMIVDDALDGRDPDDLSTEERDALHARINEHPDVVAARENVEAAEESAKQTQVEFTFRQLPSDVYEILALDHPPTEDQKARRMLWNPETYIPALIAACCTDDITPEQVSELIYGRPGGDGEDPVPPVLNQGDVSLMVEACREVNEKRRGSLGKGSSPTHD